MIDSTNPLGQGPVRRMGYARIAKLAIYRYHKGSDRAPACAYLLQACQRNGLNNSRRIDAATATLDSYIDWAEQNDPVVDDVMIRVELNLGSELFLGGEVSRVDVNRRGGYSAILLDPPPDGWREQLRRCSWRTHLPGLRSGFPDIGMQSLGCTGTPNLSETYIRISDSVRETNYGNALLAGCLRQIDLDSREQPGCEFRP